MKKLLLIAGALGFLTASGGVCAAATQGQAGPTQRTLPLPGYSMEQLQMVSAAGEEGGQKMENYKLIQPGESTVKGAAAADSGLVKGHAPSNYSDDAAVMRYVKDKLAERRAKPLTGEEKLEATLTAGAAGGALTMAAIVFGGLGALAGSQFILGAIMAVGLVAAGAYLIHETVQRYQGKIRVDEKSSWF